MEQGPNERELTPPQPEVRGDQPEPKFHSFIVRVWLEETAAEGPSGAIGKSLPDKDKTLNHEELALKEEMKRAYLNFLSKKAKK